MNKYNFYVIIKYKILFFTSVLGYLLGMMLVLTALSPFIITEIFADSFVVNYDEQQYNFNDALTISGEILEFKMSVIAMSIYDPDGVILSANNLEITPENTFSKSIILDPTLYEKIGEYLIKLDYAQTSQNYYFILESENIEPEISVADLEETKITILNSDKDQYTDGDIISIVGKVSQLDSPTVLIGIYDPFGMPAGFYFGNIDSNLEFSTSFLVKAGVNFRVDGTYSIKAHYAETEINSFFDFYKDLPSVIENDIEIEIQEHLSEEITEDFIDEIISNNSNTLLQENTTNETISEENYSSINEVSIIENFQIKETNTTDKKNTLKKFNPINEIKQTNLSVEDIELGELLNQINLECDSSIFTDIISYYDGMGPALYRLCKFDSSLNFFNESLIDNPYDIEILTNKGSALGKLGHFSEAIVYYDQAIEIDPNFLYAKNNKANALINLKNFDDAISLYREILEKNPNYITTQNNLEIALSLSPQVHNAISESESIMNDIYFQESSLNEKTDLKKDENEKSINFLEKVSNVFSSFSSMFDFLN